MKQVSAAETPKYQPSADQNARRARAIKAAGRHSIFVRVIKYLIVLGALGACVGLGLYLYYDPFAKPKVVVNIDKTSLDGSHVTMEAPRLSGYRADGRAYDLQARSGIQDLTKPSIIDLVDVDARFDTSDQGKAHVRAPSGKYDSARDFMSLFGDVVITSESGYDIHMHNADIDFKAGTMNTAEPVQVTTRDGHILSERMNMRNNGELITFDGNVHSQFTLPDSSHESPKPKAN